MAIVPLVEWSTPTRIGPDGELIEHPPRASDTNNEQ
jgi:hypothetical protein